MTNQVSDNSQESQSEAQQNQQELHQKQIQILDEDLKTARDKAVLSSLINFLVLGFIVALALYFIFFLFGAIESNSIGLTKVGSGFIIGLLLSLLTYINNFKFTNMSLKNQSTYERGMTQIAGQLGSIQETLKLLPEMRADLKAIPEMRADLKAIQDRLSLIETKINQ